jgi:hypothetical protein
LLPLSRTDQRLFTRERVDLSPIADEATETLLQMTTNLLHNAIVHNLPEHGAVQLSTAICPESVMLTVENTGDSSAHSWSRHSPNRSSAAPNAYTVTMQVSASAWQS